MASSPPSTTSWRSASWRKDCLCPGAGGCSLFGGQPCPDTTLGLQRCEKRAADALAAPRCPLHGSGWALLGSEWGALTFILVRAPRHLAPLFDNPKLDKELRAMLREKFPEFCSSPSPPVEGTGPPTPRSPASKEGGDVRAHPAAPCRRRPCAAVRLPDTARCSSFVHLRVTFPGPPRPLILSDLH